MEQTLSRVWGIYLFCCAILMFVLMLVLDAFGWLLTFGQKDGHKLLNILHKEEE